MPQLRALAKKPSVLMNGGLVFLIVKSVMSQNSTLLLTVRGKTKISPKKS